LVNCTNLTYSQSFNYQVDRLFHSQSTTEEIYENLVESLVTFAWKGGIGTLFAYGQTGSGKTFTINRLQQLVAESLMDGSLVGPRQVHITIIDLAGNSAYDLLNSRTPILLQEDSFGATQLTGAFEHLVQSRDDFMALIERAASFRRTAPTLKNDASSRSHSICRIRIRNSLTNSEGILYLIDLAGSEAARDVAVHGADRMRETREINMSLSVLKDCIRSKVQADALMSSAGPKLRQKKPHVPFRQSALTKVLKHVFDPAGRQACKTVVIACVNPSLADVGPSKNTLRYAEMLRVIVPATKDISASNSSESVPGPSTAQAGSSELSSGLLSGFSSRDLDPTAVVPFKERIRPGMVVSWKNLPGRGLDLDVPEGLNLAAILCPVKTVQRIAKDALGNVINTTESDYINIGNNGADDGASYLCAFVKPGLMAETYELNLWRQVVIDVSSMDKEIILEYDARTRYYYISAQEIASPA
jgi:kinesin family protein 2/24